MEQFGGRFVPRILDSTSILFVLDQHLGVASQGPIRKLAPFRASTPFRGLVSFVLRPLVAPGPRGSCSGLGSGISSGLSRWYANANQAPAGSSSGQECHGSKRVASASLRTGHAVLEVLVAPGDHAPRHDVVAVLGTGAAVHKIKVTRAVQIHHGHHVVDHGAKIVPLVLMKGHIHSGNACRARDTSATVGSLITASQRFLHDLTKKRRGHVDGSGQLPPSRRQTILEPTNEIQALRILEDIVDHEDTSRRIIMVAADREGGHSGSQYEEKHEEVLHY
jgi:hypothetical protein